MNFTKNDIEQIESKGLTLEDVESQIELFKTGIPFTNITEAATIGNGIIALNESVIEETAAYFDAQKNKSPF